MPLTPFQTTILKRLASNRSRRFFPIEQNDLLGWKLHWFDAITNKALAMGSRAERGTSWTS